MGIVCIKESAAAATGLTESTNNLMNGSFAEVDNWVRKVTRWAAVGSDADGELELVLYYGQRRVSNIQNFDTVEGITAFDLVPIHSNLKCRAGEAISVRLEGDTQSATNPIYVLLEIKEIVPARR